MSDITNAIKQICEEKNLSYEAVLETIESALAAAYRKDFGEKNQNVKVEFDPETGKSKVYDVKTVVEDMPEELLLDSEGTTEDKPILAKVAANNVVEEKSSKKKAKAKKEEVKLKEKESAETAAGAEEPVEEIRKFNPKTELQIKDAKLIKKSAKIDEVIKTKLTVPEAYGRMAAQTAKQVIIQKLREAEREMIFSEFKNKEHEVVAGVIQRREGNVVLVDLGKAVGVLPSEEQIMGERYNPGDRIKVYVKYVGTTTRGPEIILSRTSDEILKKVFYLEIPEIANGLVEIKGVAREAGNRSKVAVSAAGENVDPIGSCVGQRGARIQTIIRELGGEKIDIIEYDEDISKFIAQALSPAKVINVDLKTPEKRAVVKVSEDQLSLAIGREGQNVRLAARLTDWKLDIVGEKMEAKVGAKPETENMIEEAPETKDEKTEPAPVEAEAKPVAEKPKKEKKSKKKEKKEE